MEISIEFLVKALAIIISLIAFVAILNAITGGSFNILNRILPI